ncbi:hypothetical protein Pan97_18330 [Bremerella volcania]|uniref:Uncharacterized protein n=1 Tax=Bremerella volcania TaxID=2527984 RepID=A0A518C6H3_9BACT|nr:hypothetical protein Pan97_18330 [Bremerella volcania]
MQPGARAPGIGSPLSCPFSTVRRGEGDKIALLFRYFDLKLSDHLRHRQEGRECSGTA